MKGDKEREEKHATGGRTQPWSPGTLALGGVFLALCLVAMLLGSVTPGVEMTLFLLASCSIYLFCGEAGALAGGGLYLAACALGAILLPNKLALIPFAVLFGLYPLIKYFVEARGGKREASRAGAKALRWGAKIAFFLMVACFSYLALSGLLFPEMKTATIWAFHGNQAGDLPGWILLAGGILVFIAYDRLLTGMALWYCRRFHRPLWENAWKNPTASTTPDIKLAEEETPCPPKNSPENRSRRS